MVGDGDLSVHPDKHAERPAAEVRGAELRMVPGQGHPFHHAVPHQVVAAVDDAIARGGSTG